MPATCETCHWFRAFAWSGADGGGCHYHPANKSGGFPIVNKRDWCSYWSDTGQAVDIDINERKPDHHDPIIGYGEGLDAWSWWGGVWYAGDGGFLPDAGWTDGPREITHWRPMPPPPVKKEPHESNRG